MTTAEHIAQLEAENKSLKERLTAALQMDAIAENQELITLKSELKSGLQLEHDDFFGNMSVTPCKDEFEALQATISRIFRVLKRLGIKF